MFGDVRVLIKGVGDLASGAAARLWRSGFPMWQDRLGGWHEVEGWRGTFDEVNNGVGSKVVIVGVSLAP